MNGRLESTASMALLLATAVLGASCYGTNVDPCYYHYGYYYGYPYCDYDYLSTYIPPEGYAPVTYREVEPQVTPHPNPDIPPKISDASVEVSTYIYVRRSEGTGESPADELLNERYPCGQGDEGFTVCAVDDLQARDTDYLVIGLQVVDPVPVEDDVNFLIIGFSFDSDNDPSNNYVPPAAQSNDYFGATDKWFATSYVPGTGWSLSAFELQNGMPAAVESEARVILEQDTAVLIVPADEFRVPTPGNRVSLFRHAGDEGLGPDANWSGLVFPPLGEPLAGL